MKFLFACLVCVASLLTTAAIADGDESISYAVSASALATSISYCHAQYGPVAKATPGGTCWEKARAVIRSLPLDAVVLHIALTCRNQSLQSCITPEISNLVNDLVRRFDAARI